MKLEFHPEAEQELIEAAAYYEGEVPGLGERLGAEVRRASDRLLEYPQIGPLIESELRKFVLDQFPYTLIYSVSAEALQIIAVAHQKRRPGYWKTRVDR